MANRLSQNGLKIIACIAMTIDHIPALMFAIPAVESLSTAGFTIGRIAAPLFLFAITESLHHTHNKIALLFRLYAANIVLAISNFTVNLLFSHWLGIWDFSYNNITTTFMFVGIVTWTIEFCKDTNHNLSRKWLIVGSLLGYTIATTALWVWLTNNTIIPIIENPIIQYGISNLIRAILPSPMLCEYSSIFIILGVLWYFSYSNLRKITTIFIVFTAISFIGLHALTNGLPFWRDFFSAGQWKMILALPFLLCYNGTRGHNYKTFFYLYYIYHRYILIAIAAIVK